ncbi:atrial natriuretic peptide receptor 2-like [Paroedura picta]|uniref:atrial natriuretic peptide receptor 2-like n=1 Tax=Paroedura picta TaxID=143630 RepID=UPI004055BC16
MAWPLLLFAALALPPSAAARPSAPATNSSSRPLTNVTLGVGVPERDVRSLLGPALELALEALEPQLSRAALCVRPVYASYRDCSVADEKSETLKAAHSPDVLLGLGCDSEDDDVGRRASDWGLPLVTAGHYYRDPEFKTMVYAGPAGSTLAVFLTLLHRRFHWTSRAAFALSRAADNSHPDHSLLRIRKRLLDAPKFIGARKKYRRPDDAVRFIRAHGRVVYIVGSVEMVRRIIHLAQVQNMTNGDYVFFYLDLFGESLRAEGHREAAKPWQSMESQEVGGLREAFQTVLVITYHEPQTTEYRQFQSQRNLHASLCFGGLLTHCLRDNKTPNAFSGRALGRTIHKGQEVEIVE